MSQSTSSKITTTTTTTTVSQSGRRREMKSSWLDVVVPTRATLYLMLCVMLAMAALIVLPAQANEDDSDAAFEPTAPMELHRRVKRALYELPDGAEQILGAELRTTFSCDGLGYGYYADQDNECKLFHICQSFRMSDGSIYNNHWSFICPNQTIFNQVSLACSHPEDSIPCESARDFYHVNDYFGDVRSPSVKEADLNLAQDLISRSYGSRLSAGN